MQGARLALLALWLGGISACAVSEPPAMPSGPDPTATTFIPEQPRDATQDKVVFRSGPGWNPDVSDEPQGSGIKGAGLAKDDQRPAPVSARADELLALQQKIVSCNPGRDEEKFRLALLLANDGEFEQAEMILSEIRAPSNKLAPVLEYFLQHQLGDHKEARRLLQTFLEEDKRITGFVIERAELCSKIRKYRDYTLAPNDHVRPGATVILYVEPRNFTLQHQQDKYLLHLKYDWRLYDDRSVEQPVPQWNAAPPNDREDRNSYAGPFEEFYQSFALPLPANLAMGHYRIKVSVTDALSGHNDRIYVPIYVTAVEAGQ